MSSAGQQLIAGRVPGERIATTVATSNSAAITTTDTIVDSVVAALVSGRTYRITFASNMSGAAINDRGIFRIREDNVTGTQLGFARITVPVATLYPIRGEAEYTAVATGNKTFVVTLIREVGTVTRAASATIPTYLYVDYIRG